jgi:hypothetical protein
MSDTEVQGQVTPAAAPATEAAPAPEANQGVDLDGLSEFTFQGEKYNPERLHQMFSEHKTYSQQVQEYQKNKQFEDNLEIDLENVLQDPRLADKFKATYPKRYHTILDKFLQANGRAQAQGTPAQAQPSALPKEFMSEFEQMKDRLRFHEDRAYQAEVQSASAKLDAMLPPLFKKYEMANEDQVYTRAEALLQQGQKLTEKTWERLVRESHDAMQKKADQVYGAKLKTQIEKGQRGADVGPGGATPGQAPVKPRTFDEAREAMLASLRRG